MVDYSMCDNSSIIMNEQSLIWFIKMENSWLKLLTVSFVVSCW